MANRKTTGKKGRKPRTKSKVLEQIVPQPAQVEAIVLPELSSESVEVVKPTPTQLVPQQEQTTILTSDQTTQRTLPVETVASEQSAVQQAS
ncbi:MAG: hypothetical protein LUO84_01855 [Methanomassiliicoccales archaeon]|nr:hypothetical protein [Methanomassiliicoccales archaeon]